jgi:hypothetical protein
MKQKQPEKRFAALLLFQFRVMVRGDPGKRRLCEKRIINFKATNGRAALKEANERGRAAQHCYKNSDGNRVHFDFVGIQDLLCLDPACEPDEVWYDIVKLVRPMERRRHLIPAESTLEAIRNNE